MELNDGAFAASKSPKADARGGRRKMDRALRHLPHYSHLKRAFWWEQCADGRRISGVPKKGFKPPKCCYRSDSSSLPQTPSVLPCLVQPSTAGLHWNVVSSPQEGSSCFLLSICSNNDLLPVGQFVTDFFVLSISDNYEVL